MRTPKFQNQRFPINRDEGSILPEHTRQRVVQVLLIAAAIGLAVLIGALMAGKLVVQVAAMAIPIALIGPFALIWFSNRLEYGLVLLIITASVTPLSLPTGTESRIADSMVVTLGLVALWLVRMLVERKFHMVKTPVNLPALLFILVVMISLFWSIAFRDPQLVVWETFPFVQAASAVVMVALPAAMIFVINFGQREGLLKVAVWIFLAAGVLGIANNLLSATIVNTRGLFSTWIVALALSLALFHEKLPDLVRLGLIGLTLAWAYYGFILGISWLAGWLPVFLAAGIITLIRSRRLTALVLLALGIIVLLNLSYFTEAFEAERTISGITRLGAWAVNWRVTGEHPLFGTGPGGYAAYYMFYYPNEGLATHSNYIDVLAQTGIVGFVIYLWLFGVLLWRGFKLWRRLAGRRDFYEAISVACLAGTVSCIFIMAFGDWLLPFAYTQTIAGFDYAVYSWIFLGVMIAVDKMTEPKPEIVPADA